VFTVSQLTAVSAALISLPDMPGTILEHCAILLISIAFVVVVLHVAANQIKMTLDFFFFKT
jgi:hypothetical protein